MAVGHAKYTGGVGVVVSTQGPGAVHLLNGLYDAKLDHVPVVALVGQQHTTVLGSEYQQEIDLQSLFKDVAAQFVATVLSPDQAAMVLDRAFRTALATRSPVVVVRAGAHGVTMTWAAHSLSTPLAQRSCRKVSGCDAWVRSSSSWSSRAWAVWARISQSTETPDAWR